MECLLYAWVLWTETIRTALSPNLSVLNGGDEERGNDSTNDGDRGPLSCRGHGSTCFTYALVHLHVPDKPVR